MTTNAPVRILTPATEADWRHAGILIAELEDWDVEQSRGLGFTRDEILTAFYEAGSADIRVDCAEPFGCLLLAMQDQAPLACAAYHRLTPETCELYNVYVRPEGRGRGIASMLLRQLLSRAMAVGYRTMSLETATFMTDAHRVYRSLGFREREPCRTLAPRFANVTLWMERDL